MADYKHDIFISYRNVTGVRDWVRRTFYNELVKKLSALLLNPPSIYLDGHMKGGTWWASDIPEALRHSKIVVAVLVPAYQQSPWCQTEMSWIEQREKLLGRYQVAGQGLVIPIAYCKKEILPKSVLARKVFEFSKHAYTSDGFLRSERYLDFEDAMGDLAAEIADLLNRVPPWDPNWPQIDPATVGVQAVPAAGVPSL